jgi:hypothetical protein
MPNEELFLELEDARRKIGAWRVQYNESRPHGSLGMRSWNFEDRVPGAGAAGIGASALPHMHLRCAKVQNRGADFLGWRGSKLPLICPCLAPEGRFVPPIGRRIRSKTADPAVILSRRRGSAYLCTKGRQ